MGRNNGHCPDGQPHHEWINSDNFGVCKRCGATHDYQASYERFLRQYEEKFSRGGIVQNQIRRGRPRKVMA